MVQNHFEKHFDYGSFLPLLLLVFGIYTTYLFSKENFGTGAFIILGSFVIYIINNIYINVKGFSTVFNEYLEDLASFVAFGLSTMVFGFTFYSGSEVLLNAIIFFYGVCMTLALARNWILKLKYSRGWPLPLNGLFFPLIYYIYVFFLSSQGNSLFLVFYVAVSLLSISQINFLGYSEDTTSKYKIVNAKNEDLEDEFQES